MNNNLMVKELLSFDRSFEPTFITYDNQPYSRDVALCGWDPPQQLYSGNVVKVYQYKMGKPVIIQTPDEEFEIPEYRRIPVDEEMAPDSEEPLSEEDLLTQDMDSAALPQEEDFPAEDIAAYEPEQLDDTPVENIPA